MSDPIVNGSEIELVTDVRSDHLVVDVCNPTTRATRLWELHNSWGWESIFIELRVEADTLLRITRRPRDWTKDGPTFFTLQPGEKRAHGIDLADGWWQVDDSDDVASHIGERLDLRSTLRIDPTPEASALNVWTGAAAGRWTGSEPPHGWLHLEVLRQG